MNKLTETEHSILLYLFDSLIVCPGKANAFLSYCLRKNAPIRTERFVNIIKELHFSEDLLSTVRVIRASLL